MWWKNKNFKYSKNKISNVYERSVENNVSYNFIFMKNVIICATVKVLIFLLNLVLAKISSDTSFVVYNINMILTHIKLQSNN